jgi:hypothetical protein
MLREGHPVFIVGYVRQVGEGTEMYLQVSKRLFHPYFISHQSEYQLREDLTKAWYFGLVSSSVSWIVGLVFAYKTRKLLR